MKIFFIIFLLIFIAILLTISLLSANTIEKKEKSPSLLNGSLLICPNKPNCINSEYPEQTSHYLPPFVIPNDQYTQIVSIAKNILLEMGATIITENNDSLQATFTSSLFKFVDDFELRVDQTSHILHIRSASRVGYSDFGVNKRRVKHFLERINQAHIKQVTP